MRHFLDKIRQAGRYCIRAGPVLGSLLLILSLCSCSTIDTPTVAEQPVIPVPSETSVPRPEETTTAEVTPAATATVAVQPDSTRVTRSTQASTPSTPFPTPTHGGPSPTTPSPTVIPVTLTPVSQTTSVPLVAADKSVTAWVSDAKPSQNSRVTVSARFTTNGQPKLGVPMTSTWHYKSKSSTCTGETGADGVAYCTRNIGGATIGYTVTIMVSLVWNGQTYIGSTSFTPE